MEGDGREVMESHEKPLVQYSISLPDSTQTTPSAHCADMIHIPVLMMWGLAATSSDEFTARDSVSNTAREMAQHAEKHLI